ncbi:MAG: DUF1295 domain-containing protein [Erysipelotrichaceae bacterium]
METLVFALLVVWAYFTLVFCMAYLMRRMSFVDVAWGMGFVTLSAALYVNQQAFDLQRTLVLTLVALWGVRLSWHLARRNLGKPEDFRYQAMRERWAPHAWSRAYVQVFMLQALFLFLIEGSVLYLMQTPSRPISLWDVLGASVALLGILVESVADTQLRRFKKQPRGRFLTTGLWKYSRHPNYFGETLVWWGIWIMALGAQGWFTVYAPLTITGLLLFVSGIPMLEAKYQDNPDYQRYAAKTSKFVLWPPKR